MTRPKSDWGKCQVKGKREDCNCDECTAWNPFPWIDGGKMCEWTLLDSDEISILGIKIVIDESVPDGEVQFRTDNKVVGKIVG